MKTIPPKRLFLGLLSFVIISGGSILAYRATLPKSISAVETSTPAQLIERPETETVPAPNLETVKPKSLKDTLNLKLEGRVIAQRKQTLSAQSEGRVTQVHALAGDTVNAGQILLQIDNPDQQIDLDALAQQQRLNSAILTSLSQKTKDYQDMLKLGLVARHDVQTVENDLRTKQIEQQGLAQQIRHLNVRQARGPIKAPQTGYVIDILSEGSYVTPGQTVATVVSSQDQYIEAYVPTEQLKAIKSGATASFDWMNDSKTARVVRITPESQSGLVKLLLQADTVLPLEFRPQLTLKLKSVSGWLLPKRSLVLVEGVPVFYRLQNHKANAVKAQVVRDLDGQVLVANKLQASDKIVSSQAEMLHEGMVVANE